MISPFVNNETGKLKLVLVGIADDFGGTPKLEECYDPKSRENVVLKKFPIEKELIKEVESFITVLKKHNIEVLRPLNIAGVNQIFSRDIVFVIHDTMIIPNIIKNRINEIDGISHITSNICAKHILKMPTNCYIEGGDVILYDKYIFVGYSKEEDFNKYIVSRTNELALNFISTEFPQYHIKGFELNKSDIDPMENALHLDCCFQPIGNNMAILYKAGFKYQEDIDFIIDLFGCDNIIEINTLEMYNMCANVFSISEDVIVSNQDFVRLNGVLRSKGFIVEEVAYSEVAKMEGLLRCSTMPLIRE